MMDRKYPRAAAFSEITSALPPAFSIFSLALAEKACARIVSLCARSPSPRIFTRGAVVGTDPVPALRRAFEVLRHAPTSRKGKLLYLLTDGDFADNKAVLAELVKLNAARDVHINTILYATTLEMNSGRSAQEMLKGIAATHGGTYKWVRVDE